MTATETDHEWRHGWVPLTLHAAILKAHGNHAAAERLLAAAGHREFVTPEPGHQAAHALRRLTDDQLADAMGAADVTEHELAVIVRELDRRDRAERKARAARERRQRHRAARDAARQAEYDRLVDAGADPEAAYATAYGVSEERQRRDQVISDLRSNGYRGRGLDELIQDAFREHAELAYWAAEGDEGTRGYLVNKAGEARGIDPQSLFTGPESRARKYASEELLRYWQQHGRLTVDDFRAGVLGGHMRHLSTAAWS